MNTKPNKHTTRRGFVIPVLIASLALAAVGLVIMANQTPPPTCPNDGTALVVNTYSGYTICPKCGYGYSLAQ